MMALITWPWFSVILASFLKNSVAFACVFKDRDLEIHYDASSMEDMDVPPDLAEVLAMKWSLNLAFSLGFE